MNLNEKALLPGFEYSAQLVDRFGHLLQQETCHNLFPTEGIKYVADLLLGVGTVIAPWYVGLFSANYSPTSATKAADLPGTVGESVAYSQVTRALWNGTYDAGLITNETDRAEFTFTADTTVYGGFLVSDGAKGSASGTLLSIARFATPFVIPSGSTFKLTVASLLAG